MQKFTLPIIRSSHVPMLLLSVLTALWFFLTTGGQPATLHARVANAGPGSTAGAGRIIFNRDIRPILADRCFSCHGPDPNKRQAGLRLDRPETALGKCPKHPELRAFVPGDPGHSEALRRILSTDPALVMPPATSHLKLDAAEKDLIRQWLVQGGDYQEHWAYTKPARAPLPAVQNVSWCRNDIDRFVLANLESQGLSPSKEADRATLIRRVSIDLTGIPPTPAEVAAFIADTAPDAYEKVVDRLLASPRYGEQMAVSWLDYARYADSHGYQSDPERHMWKWRDWVINAYNSNMPFDEFTIEQLAGDLLPNATVEQKIATGFNRNHRINDEGGIINEEWRVEGVIDRVSTTSAVFMGLTLECCRCHDHKYDPITQKEFYSFSAFFNSINEIGAGPTGFTDRGNNVPPIMKVPTPEQSQKLAELAGKNDQLESKLAELRKRIPDRVAALNPTAVAEPAGLIVSLPLHGDLHGYLYSAGRGTGAASLAAPATQAVASTQPVATTQWVASTQAVATTQPAATAQPITTTYVQGKPMFVDSAHGQVLSFKGNGEAVNAGAPVSFERTDSFSYGAWIYRKGTGAILSRMDVAHDFRGFDFYLDGDSIAVHIIHHWPDNALKVHALGKLPINAWTHVFATYDGSSKPSGVHIYFNGKSMPTAVNNDTLTGSILTQSPLLIGKRDGADFFNGNLCDVKIFNRALSPAEVAAVAGGDEVRRSLAVPTTQRSPQQNKSLADFVEATDTEMSALQEQIRQIKTETNAVDAAVADTMVMEELPKPRDTFVLIRGDYDKHGEKVQPGVPAVLPPLPANAPLNRLTLARWIVSPDNPLTPRVQANRLWEKFFGVGLVKTSENMGVQTEWPSNPELLDWLATEMLRLHWDLKAFQREIVLSAAYRQSSEMSADMLERDPENRLIERGSRFRMSAEEIRDQALAASGLLVEQIGGPSARPYEPDSLWSGNAFGNLAKYMPDTGAGLYRRSVYTFIKRTAAPANLTLFDQPSREYCVIRRSRTDTPLQALDLMNDPQYLEAARVLAQHLMKDIPGSAADRITEAFKRITSRAPTDAELKILLEGYDKALVRFTTDPADAAHFLAVGSTPIDPALNAPQLAAFTLSCSVIFNLDETVTRQ